VDGMSEDFIRYYIGGVHFFMLETVQRESGKFNEWQLIKGSEFDYKHSYGYEERFIQDEPLLELIAKQTVIAETKQPKSVESSKLWEKAPNIDDVLTLISIARARYYSILIIENHDGLAHDIKWGLITKELEGYWDIVSFSNLGRFISEALTYIENNRKWLEESGFKPSIYWLMQAQKSCCFAVPSILEMGLYWVSLEVLSRAYIVTQGVMDVKDKKERVKRFITDKGYSGNNWDFLDKAIDDWYIARNDLFHEGTEKLPIDLLAKRGKQIRDFTSLVFVEMLQQQGEARKQELASRMKNY
jgi:hypothetical protein